MRRKASRRPLALLLAFVLCIGMLPAPALAQGTAPEEGADFALGQNISAEETAEISTLAAPENIALGKPVTMTGATMNEKLEYQIEKINDGDRDATRIALASIESEPVYFDFDLESEQWFDRIEIYERCDRGYGDDPRIGTVEVQIPDGADGWRTVETFQAPGESVNDDNDNDTEHLTIQLDSAVSASAVRLAISPKEDNVDAQRLFTIWEVEIYSAEPPAGQEGAWRMQSFGGNTDLEIPEGAVVPAEEGLGFTADYSKIYGSESAPSGNVVIYYAGGERYEDSVLEFTANMAGEENGRYRLAVFPRFRDGQNCDGIAIDTPAALQHSYRIDNQEGWPGLSNLLNKTFEVGKDYRFRLIASGNTIAMYLDEGSGYQKLAETGTAGDLGAATFGFRVWGPVEAKDLKKLEIKDVSFRAYVMSSVDSTGVTLEEDEWGTRDVTVPITLGDGDTVESVSIGSVALTPDQDYTLGGNVLTIKKEYIAGQENTFTLSVAFAGGVTGSFTVAKYQESFVYVEDFGDGAENWVKQSGSGTAVLEEGGLHITGETLLVDTASPVALDGEVEFLIEPLNDNGNFGLVFRAGTDGTWQSFYNSESARYQYATGLWNYRSSGGANTQVLEDGTPVLKRPEGVGYTMKVRFAGQTLTVWMDGNPIYSADLSQMGQTAGQIGIQTGSSAEVLLRQVTYRGYEGLAVSESTQTRTIASESGLSVTLAEDFPRVVGYTLNGKSLDGSVLAKNYVSINGTDYPASAVVSASDGSSVTYAVTADLDGDREVTFNVTFTAQADNILDMQITGIDETDCTVYTLGFPEQPLLSAGKSDEGAAFNASTRSGDVNLDLAGGAAASKTATSYATIAIVTANGLSASMANNVYNNRMEFSYRSFDLEGGDVVTGVWNTDFYYRGLDGEFMLPDGENPSCQVAVTEDTNGDSTLNWQDGANALKLLVGDRIPGAETVRNSDIHVGYNFVSEAQNPFLKIGDNYKRLGNLIDGFDQVLVLKGYANEGHDSGHADYADINKRAGGAEDLNLLTDELEAAGLGTFGIHINHSEAYPEAEMFNDETMSTKNGWRWMDQSKYIRREVDIMDEEGGMAARLDDLFTQAPGIGFVYVDTYRDDRFAAARLAQSLTGDHGVILATEDASKLDRWTAWTHGTQSSSTIHRFVYHTQKDVYGSSGNFWGGYNRATSMMSWQHNWNITPLVEIFYTNQLPQKYLMHHEVLRLDGNDAYFEGNIRTNNYQMWKDDKLMVGNGGYFIPWYAEDSETRNPDDADKIYYWNNNAGSATWDLPNEEWAGLSTVYLYKTTQNGKVLVDTLKVNDGKVTINAEAKTPYVLYPGEAAADVTEWSVDSPIKDTSFNSRDFSIWQKDGEANIHYQDDGNGVSILYMEGTEAGQVSQTMTGLVPGQKYRALVWAGAENGKTARITVETPDGQVYENYVDQIVRATDCYDTYAKGKRVERVWVDFVQPEGETTATITLSADACEASNGKATFMESRIVKTAEPDLPEGYVANETFEYVEQGGTGIFTPEGGGDGGYHLSHYTEYTDDAINIGGEWSLKMYGYGSATMRTYPATMRLEPNTEYTMEFDALGSGTVSIVSESDSGDQPMSESFAEGHSKFTFTTGDKSDYIARIWGSRVVLDNFQVYRIVDETPPTVPGGLTARAEEISVVLSWSAASDEDSGVSGYRIYRDGAELARVGSVTTYTDLDVSPNTEYTYQVSAVNGGGTEGERSEAAVVSVGADEFAPRITSASLESGSLILTFNEALEKTSAETAENYRLSGTAGSVTAASLAGDGRTVTLTLRDVGAAETILLRVVGVQDLSGNATAGDQEITISSLIRYLKLDETEGTVAVDDTGNGNGTKSATVGSTDGRKGLAAQFNGDGYIDLAPDTLSGQEEYTISLWMKWDGSTAESNTIFSNNTSGLAGSVGVWLRINSGGIITADNLEGGRVATSTGAAVNEWTHVALVRRTDGTDVYINGEKSGTGTPTIRLGDNKLRIGGNFNGSGALLHKFHGAIDEFKIFAAALSAEDIQAIASEGFPPEVVDGAVSVTKGMERDLTVRVRFYGAALTGITDQQGAALVAGEDYTVTDTAVILKADYLRTLGAGEHTLTLAFDDETGTTGTLTIQVEEQAEGVYLSTRFVRLDAGDTLQLTATTLPETQTVTWSSTNPDAAAVNENGLVTAAGAGTAVITAAVADGRTASCTVVVNGYLRTWYTEPASSWLHEALPIGNGNLGGMVFGKTDKEQVQVNEITLWGGGPNVDGYTGGNKAGASDALKSIQDAMFQRENGDYSGINVNALLGNETGCYGYQNLGDITMDYTGKARTTTPENYLRELDLEDSMVRVSYDSAGVHFTREYFASYPGNVMAIRLTADEENALAFTLAFTPDNSGNAKTFTTRAEDGSIYCQGKVNSSQMAFAVQLTVEAPGADITSNDDGTVTVANGEDVLILMTAGTNYDITESKNIHEIADFQTEDGDYLDNDDPDGDVAAQEAAARIDEAVQMGYGALLKRHMEDYQEIFGRVTLDLGDEEKAALTTDKLVEEYKTERNSYLETLLFQYGRYLLLSSSRDSLPANLQGIWNNSNSPGWNSDYHFNVNVQMNYWPAFVTNMAETGMPLVEFMDSLRNPGNVTAREHFGTENGWVVNTEVNPFGKTAPGSGFTWGFTPGSGAWACLNLWDYYEFTQDPEVLEAIYPTLKEGAQFWLEYLVEDPRTRVDGVEGTGELVTAPGGSSEHGGVGIGTTYDMSLAYMQMSNTISAAEVLGVDADLCAELQAALDRMHPFQIGTDGQLKEWREETGYSSMPGSEPYHRHLSHLLALHPGNLITEENSIFSEYYDAAVTALTFREDGYGGVGWSMAQKANMWARVGNSEMALHHLNLLVEEAITSNLLDYYQHPQWGDIFQIDGNFGFTSAVAEMLIQSHQGFIEPLPALPEAWANGSYTGLMARGNFETDASWENGSLARFAVRSGSGGECVVRYPNISQATLTGADFTVVDANTVKFDTVEGGEYIFTGIPEYRPVESITVTSPSGVTLLEREGQTIQLSASVAPANASDLSVTWKVTREDGTATDAATIDQNGLLTATAAAVIETVKVTATARDGSGIKGELLIAVVTDRTGGANRNVALNRPVTMTGAQIYDRDDLKLTNINDGNRSTRMAVATAGQQEADIVFEFELDGTKIIDRVELYEYLDRAWGANGRVDQITVQIPDGDGWKTVAEQATPDDGAGNGSRQLTVAFEAVAADRVRVIATDNDLACPTIWELEIYGVDPAVEAADKTALIAKLEESASLTEEDFSGVENGWSNYTAARTAAVAVANDPAATQQQVDDALETLIRAIEAAIPAETYTITIADMPNGKVEADKSSAAAGETVKLTVTPDSGYQLKAGSLKANGVVVENNQFTMPAEDVTVTAEFEAAAEPESPVVTQYIITASTGEGGGISPTGSIVVQRGQSKTFDITANEGYVIADVLVDGESVGAVSSYTFENVRGRHTIEAVFKAAGEEGGSGFTDVPADAWYTEAVEYVTEKGLMNGTGETTFSPMLSMSRSMLVTVLYRLAGEPEAGECPFTDVPDGTWYTDAVAWAAENGIVTGVSETSFVPDAAITRESLAVILYRYADVKEQGEKGDLTAFADGASVSEWAADAMSWAVGEGILTGKGGSTLDPQGTATRAEVAAMLMRFCAMTEK